MNTLNELKRFVHSVSTVSSTAGSAFPADTPHSRYATTTARNR